ncbi:MAG: hypothetical protein ACKPEO_25150, partial [Sphaerospermopsis kisseleviana]
LKKNVWKVGGSALAKLTEGIAVLEVEGMRSLFGEVEEVRSLFGGLKRCDRFWGVEEVRSLFGKLKGCDRCFGS